MPVESEAKSFGNGGNTVTNLTGKIEMHHLLPKAQRFRQFFNRAGLDVEKFKIPLDKAIHRLKPGGVHTGPENWNKMWDIYMRTNPNAEAHEILQHLGKMRKLFGI